jgi:hypothetical protein
VGQIHVGVIAQVKVTQNCQKPVPRHVFLEEMCFLTGVRQPVMLYIAFSTNPIAISSAKNT